MYRFGELNVARVRRILAGDTTPEPVPPRGKPPALCPSCPHRTVFEILRKLDCIVSGDIGCYSLGALPPLEAMDSLVCMGASIGMGLGLRHVLPEDQARRVVSVIGDSTFVHSGITGLVEMVYNPPQTGHVVLILDNGTTAMTGLQEHPGTGRSLDHRPAGKVVFEDLGAVAGRRLHDRDRSLARPRSLRAYPRPEPGFQPPECHHRATAVPAGRRQDQAVRAVPVDQLAAHPERGLSPTVFRPPFITAQHARPKKLHEAMPHAPTTNVVVAGLGGQGVLKASDILAEAAFAAGLDVKKAEVHGMSQRGGSVTSDVRFGDEVLSPMVPPGEADFLLVLAADQLDVHRGMVRDGGVTITPDDVDSAALPHRRSLNVALLGVLSRHLTIPPSAWQASHPR